MYYYSCTLVMLYAIQVFLKQMVSFILTIQSMIVSGCFTALPHVTCDLRLDFSTTTTTAYPLALRRS
jgi:hypothetical protein